MKYMNLVFYGLLLTQLVCSLPSPKTLKENNKACIMVIDMLNNFVSQHGENYNERYSSIVPAINRVIKNARKNQIQVLFMQQGARRNHHDNDRYFQMNPVDGIMMDSEGHKVFYGIDQNRTTDIYIEKRRPSSFFGTDLDLTLREEGCSNLIMVGIKTNECIRSTVQDAFNLDYNIYIPSNCVNSDDAEAHKVNLSDMEYFMGARVVNETEIFIIMDNKNYY